MTLSVRELCIADVVTTLEALDGVTVYRMRRAPVDTGKMPAVVVTDGPHTAANYSWAGRATYTLTLTIEGYVVAASDAAVGPAVNALYASVVAALMADVTRGGHAIDTRDGELSVDIADAEGAKPAGGFVLSVEIDFSTVPGDPTTASP